MKIMKAMTQKHFFELRQVRVKVFVIGQNVPIEIELDDDDKDAIHIVAYQDNKICGTARLVINDGYGKVGRVAVLDDYQGQKIGKLLMEGIEKESANLKIDTLILESQYQVEGFYKKIGYQSYGEYFYEANIKHIMMKKHI